MFQTSKFDVFSGNETMYFQIFPEIIFTLITPLADTGFYLIYIWEDKITIILLTWIEEHSDSRIKEMAKKYQEAN